jgi:DNA-binding CsgD family transcriptional regulator
MQQQLYKRFAVLIVMLSCCLPAFSQTAEKQKWVSLFNLPFDKVHIATQVLWDSIQSKPKEDIYKIISGLDKEKSISSDDAGQVKLLLLKIRYCSLNSGYYDKETWPDMGSKAIRLCNVSENDYLLQSTYFLLGEIFQKGGNNGMAIFYLMKACAMAEDLGYKKAIIIANRVATSSALYHTENYDECIAYCRSDLDLEEQFPVIIPVTAYNNTGLSYLKLNRFDSAIFYFSKVVNFCRRINYGVWTGIASGNIGDVLHLEGRDAEAMPYWQMDYDSSMRYNELKNAGLTLAYMSEYQFNNGEQQKAIKQLQWAEAVNIEDAGNLQRVYQVKYACYKKMGLYDSADFFLKKHYYLTDSLNKVISQNNFNTVELKLSFEKSNQEYQLLKKERQAEVTRRNLLLLALVSIALIGILLYNRQRLKIKLARQQQAIAEAEKDSAKEQLLIFTQTLLEKNDQIEQLNTSLQQQTVATNDELIHQTLLTDYDWNRFKELFEKIHPDFFNRLKNAAAGVTQSEMRLAALIKLNLDNKQMASMQGISVSSLRGNKTRLRQKLNISVETDLEDVIKQL